MNQQDKKELRQALSNLKNLSPILNEITDRIKEREQLKDLIEQIRNIEPDVEEIVYRAEDKEQELTDKQRETYKGEVIEKTAEDLRRALDGLQDCISYLENVLDD